MVYTEEEFNYCLSTYGNPYLFKPFSITQLENPMFIAARVDGVWGLYYSSEEELVKALKNLKFTAKQLAKLHIRGYEYIASFNTQLQYKNELSNKQLIVAKKNAREIKIAAFIQYSWERKLKENNVKFSK